jgi:hypothetical protein
MGRWESANGVLQDRVSPLEVIDEALDRRERVNAVLLNVDVSVS